MFGKFGVVTALMATLMSASGPARAEGVNETELMNALRTLTAERQIRLTDHQQSSLNFAIAGVAATLGAMSTTHLAYLIMTATAEQIAASDLKNIVPKAQQLIRRHGREAAIAAVGLVAFNFFMSDAVRSRKLPGRARSYARRRSIRPTPTVRSWRTSSSWTCVSNS